MQVIQVAQVLIGDTDVTIGRCAFTQGEFGRAEVFADNLRGCIGGTFVAVERGQTAVSEYLDVGGVAVGEHHVLLTLLIIA